MNQLYPWQYEQWRRLLSAHHQGRLPHALLLSGPEGMGKMVFARELARLLLCQSAQPLREQACGVCSGCRLTAAGNHPDLMVVSPEEESKIIKIDQIRQLTASVGQTAHRAGYQVVIFYPAENLNKAAANALLKTLEEPSGSVIFLLVSHQPGALPPTILSRCQRITFSGCMNDSNTLNWLTQELKNLNLTANAELLLKSADHAPLRALALAQKDYMGTRDQLLAHLLAVSQRKINPIEPVAIYLKQDLELWLNTFISLAIDLMRLHLNAQPKFLTHSDRLTELCELNQHYPLQVVPKLLEKLNEARKWLINSNIHLNPQLLLENLLISFS